MTASIAISFVGLSAREANDAAAALKRSLERDRSDLRIEFRRASPLAQDFGASLILLFGTPAVVALAHGIAKWLASRQKAELILRRTDAGGAVRELEVKGQPTARMERMVHDFLEGAANERYSITNPSPTELRSSINSEASYLDSDPGTDIPDRP